MVALTDPIDWAVAIPMPYLTDYRLQVRACVPAPSTAVIGQALIGESYIGALEFVDLTADAEGLSFVRGGSAGDVPEAGELTLRLRNESQQWSPWVNAYYGAGTLVQVIVGDAGAGQHSQFVGLVSSWVVSEAVLAVDSWVDITAVEPFGLLAQVDRVPLAVAVGDNDDGDTRLFRLIDDAAYPYAGRVDIGDAYDILLNATTMAGNLMVELRKLAQSLNAQVFSGKDAAVVLLGRGELAVDEPLGIEAGWFPGDEVTLTSLPDLGDPDGGTIPYVSGSLVTANDDRLLISSLTLGRVGGASTTTYEQSFGSRYGTRTVVIDDLPMKTEVRFGWLADQILSRGDELYRPSSIDVTSLHGEAAMRFILAADVTRTVPKIQNERMVDVAGTPTPQLEFLNYSVCRLTNYIRPVPGSLVWDLSVEFDVEATSEYVVNEAT